jgi:predicted enzyme related to lactoylglutathione lyase
MAITPEMAEHGARPAWVGYIRVDDVDVLVQSIIEAGGNILMPAMDIEGVGRMAMVADPQGAPYYIMKGASDETSHSFAATEPKPGHCAWNELATSNPEAAIRFYTSQFGWSAAGEMDMGEMGAYRFLQASGQRFMLGAAYQKVEADPVSHWLYYFRVPNLDVASETIKQLGGQIHMEPVALPEGPDFSLIAYDPAGAAFGLVGPMT